MAALLRDHHVTFTHEETLASLALEWREAHDFKSPRLNIVDFIENTLCRKFRKGPLKIMFFNAQAGAPLAFVDFNPLTLHVDREIWELGRLGDPDATFILAHEVGHIILHDHLAKAFSNDPDAQIRFAQKEYSAEWQANTFAAYLLVPTKLVLAYDDLELLIVHCGVTRNLARDRLEAVEAAMKPRPKIEGDFCIECGQFVLRKDRHDCDPALRYAEIAKAARPLVPHR